MKNCLLLLFLFPLASFAQDSCGLKKTKDPFTNVTKLSTGFKKFDGGGLAVSISADATPTEIDFFIWLKDDSKCFDLESTAQVVWEGERSKATFRNTGSMNCDGAFHFNFKNTATPNSWLRKMISKKIATIKLLGNGGKETIITLDEEQKILFQKMVSCIVAQGLPLRTQ